MILLLFWASIALVAYTYAGYPLLLMLRARLAPRPFRAAESEPRVSLIVCAHNEVEGIARKVENLLGSGADRFVAGAGGLPPRPMRVTVAAEGSPRS